jgi:soluble lytic murein transglycosylase-like protein
VELPAGLNAILRRIAQIDPADFQAPLPAALPAAVPKSGLAANFDALIDARAAAWHVDKALVKAIVANESAFDPRAKSSAGAQGLMQLEPATAAELGVTDPYDPAQNVNGGTRYISGLLERFHGDIRLALAAYNAGAGAVEKYGGVPPYAETRAYVEHVMESYRRYKQQR